MSYKCMMCQQLISKKEDEWAMEISLTKWMHYKCIEHLWDAYSSMRKQGNDNRVRCTADGEFPEQGEVVYFEIYDVHYLGKFLEKETTISIWKDFSDEQPYDWYKLDVPIYWIPLSSLKAQCERERE